MKFNLLIIITLLGFNSYSQSNNKIDVTQYIKEIQIWEKDRQNMSLAFWSQEVVSVF